MVTRFRILFLIGLAAGVFARQPHALTLDAAPAQFDAELWTSVVSAARSAGADTFVTPRRLVRLNRPAFDRLRAAAPRETGRARPDAVVITLPLPDGGVGRFRVENSPILEPFVAAAAPDIQTYRGRGVDDPTATVRFDWTPAGFHAIVLT